MVVGLDASEEAANALDVALEEVGRRDEAVLVAVRACPMPVFYGVDPALVPRLRDAYMDEARTELDAALQEVPADVEVEPVVVAGGPASVLIEQSRTADLVVVGSRGRGGFSSLLLGSTSAQVVTHAHCPVVVVPHTGRVSSP